MRRRPARRPPTARGPVDAGFWSADGDNAQRPCFNAECPGGSYRSGACDNATGVGYRCEVCVDCGAGEYEQKPCSGENGTFVRRTCGGVEPGYYSPNGDNARYACSPGYYNPTANSSSATACIACHEHATTATSGATLQSDCVCDAGFYENADGACQALPAAVEFVQGAIGLTRETLPVREGFWRATKTSITIYMCGVRVACPGADVRAGARRADAAHVKGS